MSSKLPTTRQFTASCRDPSGLTDERLARAEQHAVALASAVWRERWGNRAAERRAINSGNSYD